MKIVVTLLGVILVSVSTAAAATSTGTITAAEGEAKEEIRVRRSDDTSLAALNAVVQEQAARLLTLQARITALENKQPASFQPVAFTARFSRDPHHGIVLSPHSTLQFDSVVTNVGNAYNPHTGIFTAPVPGLYVFFLAATGSDIHDSVKLAIVRGGQSVLGQVYGDGYTDRNDQGSSQVSTRLAVGEQVWVRQEEGDLIRGSYWTVFTGYLVQAD